MKINKHIQIVRSATPRLSSMGEKSCAMILALLRQHYEKVGVTTVNDVFDLAILAAKQPDLVILGMKQIPNPDVHSSEPVWLADYLDSMQLNYTGSTAAAIALDYDKPAAKQVVKAAELKTSLHFMATPGQYSSARQLPLAFPLFIKPPNTGGGKGISAASVVRDFMTFENTVQAIASEFKTSALVENYLPGREFSVAIFGTADSNDLLAMPIELVAKPNANGDRILGVEVKSEDSEQVIGVTDPVLRAQINGLAMKAFRALGARDYGRIDIRLDANGVPHFLEANLIPGLAQNDFTSYFIDACIINEHMNYESIVLRLVEVALARQPQLMQDATDIELRYLSSY